MGMTKEEYEAFRKTRTKMLLPDDDLFNELSDLPKTEDLYVWSTIGQCWLPK